MQASDFTIPPLIDISVSHAKYLIHILGPATEIMIKITMVDVLLIFNILNCKNYPHLSIQSKFNNRNTIYQNKVNGKMFSLPCLQVLVSVIMDKKEIKHRDSKNDWRDSH